jgi:hypothetical protein
MTGGVIAPAVIAPMAFILLAVWLALVFWAADHPAHREHRAHQGFGVVSRADAVRAREDEAQFREDEARARENEARAREDADRAHEDALAHEAGYWGGARDHAQSGRRAA